MGKEYLVMVKVTADRAMLNPFGNVDCALIGGGMGESLCLDPSRLIDPTKELEYACPRAGDMFLDRNGDWFTAVKDIAARYLIHRKPKPKDKWQAWAERCPLFVSSEMRMNLTEWIRDGIEIEKGE